MSDEPSEEAEYGLLYPFVVCKTQGGPYDDEAFCAGAEMEQVRWELDTLTTDVLSRYVKTPLLPQLDLVAMHCGFSLVAESWDEHPDEWSWATFKRSAVSP